MITHEAVVKDERLQFLAAQTLWLRNSNVYFETLERKGRQNFLPLQDAEAATAMMFLERWVHRVRWFFDQKRPPPDDTLSAHLTRLAGKPLAEFVGRKILNFSGDKLKEICKFRNTLMHGNDIERGVLRVKLEWMYREFNLYFHEFGPAGNGLD